MSTLYNPQVSTNGLIMCLDPANTRSYPRSGTTVVDISNSNNSGSLMNSPTFSNQNGGVFTFDGINDYMVVPDNFFNHNAGTPFTVSMWFKTSVASGILLGQQNTNTVGSATGYVPAIYVDTANKLRISCFWGGNTAQSVTTANVTDNVWHNITVTFASSTQVSYLDGLQFDSIAKTQTNYSSTYYYFVGAGSMASWPSVGGNIYFTGNITNFLFYNRQLSSSEVLQNFNATRSRFGV